MKIIGKYVFLIVAISYITGCAIGRSWDNPSISNNEESFNTSKSVVLYSRENSYLIKNAFSYKESQEDISPFIVKELKDTEEDKYPLLLIKLEDPKYSNDLISYSYTLSFLTLSILPGYMNQASNITLELKQKDDKGNIESISKKYVAKRHFINWFLLLPFANYGSIVTDEWGTSNTSSFWNEAYEYYIEEFLLEEKKSIMQYDRD